MGDMSASPMARAATQGQDIPTRRVVITSEEDMPADYSSTPGGTIFGTTPGGTKIVYERAFLVNMRNSPLSRTPPTNLPSIPGVTSDLGKRSRSLRTTLRCPTRRGTRMGTTSSPWISDFHVIVLLPFYTKFLVLKVCFKSQTLSVPFLCLKFFLTCFSLLQLVSWHSF